MMLPDRPIEEMPLWWQIARVKSSCLRIEALIMKEAPPGILQNEIVIIEKFLALAKKNLTEGNIE